MVTMCIIITSDPQPEAFVEPYFIPAIAGSALSALLPTPLVLPSLGVKIFMIMMILMIMRMVTKKVAIHGR